MHTFKNANFDCKFTRVDDFKETLHFSGELKDIVKSLKGIVKRHHVTQSQHPAVVYPNLTNLASDRAVLKGKSDSHHKKKVSLSLCLDILLRAL